MNLHLHRACLLIGLLLLPHSASAFDFFDIFDFLCAVPLINLLMDCEEESTDLTPTPPTPTAAPVPTPTAAPTPTPLVECSDDVDDDDTSDCVFYEDIPDMPNEDILAVMNWIKTEVTLVKSPFCWKNSYGRGVGEVLTECAPGRVKIGALCYSQCPQGYSRFGVDCHQNCPSGLDNNGLFCRNSEYGRGFGYAWTFADGFSDAGMFRRCEADHGRGNCEKCIAIVYPKCKPGFSPVGCNICRPAVPNCAALGMNPGIDLSCAKKIIIGDPVPLTCKSHLQLDGALCYPYCNDGFYGVGPVCWGTCQDSAVDCGAACADETADCVSGIFDQAIAPLILAANIATLGLATPATAGASATIQIGGKVVAGSSKVGKAVVKVVKSLQTIRPGGVKSFPTVYHRIKNAKTGTLKAQRKTTQEVGKAVYKASQIYREEFVADFAGQTSTYIEEQIDLNFHPDTAKYLKGAWADVQLDELKVANDWAIADTALAFISIVDITGVTGVVSAYAKPICLVAVDFPCIDANLSCM